MMNAFYDNKRKGDYEFNMMMDQCESWANNCHQKTNQEIIDYMRMVLTSFAAETALTPVEAEALEEANIIVDLFEEQMQNR